MEMGVGEERRDYDHEPEQERGQHGRSNNETDERREYDKSEQRRDHERGEDKELERSQRRRDREQEGRGEHERDEDRGHPDWGQERDRREHTENCHPYTTKRRPRHRDIRHVNYAFSGPHEDVAEKEAQEWLDNLSIAGGEEENGPFKIWPKGQKYRTGTTNASPQMQERLQRCEQDQKHHEYRKHIPRLGKRNESPDIYPLLHLEENYDKSEQAVPSKLWGNTRKSSIGNNSASVYAVMHPGSENGDHPVRKNPPNVHRNHLKEHRAAIAEMSAMTHIYKQKESEEEARRLAAVKIWDGSNFPRRSSRTTQLDCHPSSPSQR